MVTPESVLMRAGDVRHRRVGEEAVVLRQASAEVLGLNPVGARLFDLLDGRTPVGRLVDRVLGELEVDRESLERDSLAFLEELLQAGVVEEVAAP